MATKKTPRASSPSVAKRMRATPQRDTPAERALQTELSRLGVKFRVQRKVVPGVRRTADIVFLRAKVAVFVDGCFWHGCPKHGTLPKKTNRAWWKKKIEDNKQRDRDTNRRLRNLGWTVVRVWEHESPAAAAKRIARTVKK